MKKDSKTKPHGLNIILFDCNCYLICFERVDRKENVNKILHEFPKEIGFQRFSKKSYKTAGLSDTHN